MIEIRDVKKSYRMGQNVLTVLKGVSLRIESGDFVAIMGPSGSGKSTLMNILGLLDVPTEGTYQLNEVETSKMTEDELSVVRREQIGFIFQQFNLLPRLTAVENVSMPLFYSKRFLGESRARDLLRQVGLESRTEHKTNELSGGQMQRVAIARALVNQPMIVLADEPTGNLDSASQAEIMGILEDLNAQGITVIIVTHEEEIARHAKRLIRVRDGVIQSDERLQTRETANPEISVVAMAPMTTSTQAQAQTEVAKGSVLDVVDYLRQGFRTLATNKVRTGLSMLGILIGVAAVVAMLALGRGATKAIEEQMSSLGSNLLNIRPGAARVGGITQESGVANRLSYEDINAIVSRVPAIKNATGQVTLRAQVTAIGKNWNTSIQGVSPSYQQIYNWSLELGRFFTEAEDDKRMRLAVIGETVRRELFGERGAIGEFMKINKVIFQVIGVLSPKGGNSFRDQDDVILIPLQTGMKRLMGRDFLDLIAAEIDSPDNMQDAQEAILDILISQHKIPLSQQSDAFQVRNMADIQQAMQQSSRTMALLLATIATISLLVGGIGIMNIMLVSVTERTREIGLRKAVGARRFDILSQFLSESVVVSVVGGISGIVLGWLITLALSAAMGWTTSVSLESVLLSFSFSVAIGIVFGVYPARKASRLNPIEALRYE